MDISRYDFVLLYPLMDIFCDSAEKQATSGNGRPGTSDLFPACRLFHHSAMFLPCRRIYFLFFLTVTTAEAPAAIAAITAAAIHSPTGVVSPV